MDNLDLKSYQREQEGDLHLLMLDENREENVLPQSKSNSCGHLKSIENEPELLGKMAFHALLATNQEIMKKLPASHLTPLPPAEKIPSEDLNITPRVDEASENECKVLSSPSTQQVVQILDRFEESDLVQWSDLEQELERLNGTTHPIVKLVVEKLGKKFIAEKNKMEVRVEDLLAKQKQDYKDLNRNYHKRIKELNVACDEKCKQALQVAKQQLQAEQPKVGVFWDFESCGVPQSRCTGRITDLIRALFCQGRKELDFTVFCDVNKVDTAHLDKFTLHNADVNHVPSLSKPPLDQRMRDRMQNYVEANQGNGRVVILTGDSYFRPTIMDYRHRYLNEVLVIHPLGANPTLVSAASTPIVFEQLVEYTAAYTVPDHLSDAKAGNNKEVHRMYIGDLPKMQDIHSKIAYFLRQYKGKIIAIRPPHAVVSFTEEELFKRAFQRLHGEKIGANFIKVHLLHPLWKKRSDPNLEKISEYVLSRDTAEHSPPQQQQQQLHQPSPPLIMPHHQHLTAASHLHHNVLASAQSAAAVAPPAQLIPATPLFAFLNPYL